MKKQKLKAIGGLLSGLLMLYTAIPITYYGDNVTTITANATQSRTSYFSTSYTLTGNGADDIVSVALAQKGKTKSQMGYTEAWCADFVSDCAKLAGLSDIIPADGYCGNLYNNIKSVGGVEVSTPQKGDIIFYYCNASSCPNSGKPWVHVGIMTSATSSIEGNSGGQVTYKSTISYTDCNGHTYNHAGTNLVIVKYLRPNYNSSDPILPATVDTSYVTPIQVYPKATSGLVNVYNNYGVAYDTSVRNIAYNDLCTIEEVYTNGFCKVTYPTSNGTHTEYAKTDDFNITKPVNLGDNFSALIINADANSKPWKPIMLTDSGNVVLGTEKNTNYDATLWQFIRNSDDGTYCIYSYKDNGILEVSGADASYPDGATVQCWSKNGGDNQKWYVIKRSDGTFLLKAKSGVRVLDINGGATDDGTNVQIWNSNDSSAQCFNIYQLDANRDKLKYSISAEKASVTPNAKVKITVGGTIPYVYNYKFHIIDPNGKETIVDNKCNPVYTLTATNAGKYIVYSEVKNPLYTDTG